MKIKPVSQRFAVCLLLMMLLSACSEPEFMDSKGNEFDWQDYSGQWLVVNYWAEWCTPCREEIPELNQLHKEAGQSVLGVNFDRPELAELQRQINALNVEFPVVQTERQQRLKDLTPQVLPTTYVFDRQGLLQHTLVGPQSQQKIESAIKQKTEQNK
ncbi:MAG: TlpA disulfide reductase family protein [Pseudomonadales bacterium]